MNGHNLQIPRGGLVALLGPSGPVKSTLMCAILGAVTLGAITLRRRTP